MAIALRDGREQLLGTTTMFLKAPPLSLPGPTVFKPAESAAEFELVHRLNHEVFAVEVGQYTPDPSGRLVDKFDRKNAYFLAIRDGTLLGMVAVHDEPPFSITDRLIDPSALRRLPGRPLEVRLLALRPEVRGGSLLFGLLWEVWDHARRSGHGHLLISGVRARLPLYERLGFRALGPGVACGSAEFVPMALDLIDPPTALAREVARWQAHRVRPTPPRRDQPRVSLLPGPVTVDPAVARAFQAPPVSHRDPAFIDRYEQVRARLGRLLGGSEVALFAGGGTLANDVVLATLAADRGAGRGLILTNGEFGERIQRQARRHGLDCGTIAGRWGDPWDLEAVARQLDRDRTIGWVYAVHLETSTGMLNDLPGLIRCARPRGVDVCVDLVSSLGAVAVDLAGVRFASAASGKALGAYAGLAIVSAAPGACAPVRADRVPASLDLAAALGTVGPTTTVGSPVVGALDRALDALDDPAGRLQRFAAAQALGEHLRRGLRRLGVVPICPEGHAAPVVTTFALPAGQDPRALAAFCHAEGIAVATASPYLVARGWVQVATMGALGRPEVDRFLAALARWLDFDPS